MKKIFKNKGIVFWITGLSGSGKTTIAKKITPEIRKIFGPTIIISGDDLRKIFKIKSYSRAKRLELGLIYGDFIRHLTNQKINVVFAVIGLFKKLRAHNKKNFKNYIEIYIKSDIELLKKNSKKKHYTQKSKLVWGKDLKPEFPKNPDIAVYNNFTRSTHEISRNIINTIKRITKK
jgi:adenylylsulfate kinase-like enzyme